MYKKTGQYVDKIETALLTQKERRYFYRLQNIFWFSVSAVFPMPSSDSNLEDITHIL